MLMLGRRSLLTCALRLVYEVLRRCIAVDMKWLRGTYEGWICVCTCEEQRIILLHVDREENGLWQEKRRKGRREKEGMKRGKRKKIKKELEKSESVKILQR